MIPTHFALTVALGLSLSFPCQASEAGTTVGADDLGRFEADAGWVSLFDGESLAGWRTIGTQETPTKGWDVQEGCLHQAAGAGGRDLATRARFGDFELEFEWKVAPGGNSGVKYRVRDKAGETSAFGPEYQVLDDGGHDNGKRADTSAGALYDVMDVHKEQAPAAGEFHQARIVARGTRIEHWLDGVQLFVVNTDSDVWGKALASSKFNGNQSFAAAGPGSIALQDHGNEVWYRNLRIRSLGEKNSREVNLFDGTNLDAWYEYGDANYDIDGDSILGTIGGGGQSFLITKEHFGDFRFEVDVKTELPGNSGIQIRSHEKENKRPFGYQIEIDSLERAWSGGLFDEARRGWLQNLEDNPAGRAAFHYQEWNHYEIEAIGPWIRVRINGVPTADTFDSMDLSGFFGLQVHSGNNTRVRWRTPRLWDHGVRQWISVAGSVNGALSPIAYTLESATHFELPSMEASPAASRYPVLRFEMQVLAGDLGLVLGNGEPQGAVGAGLAAFNGKAWHVSPQASATYKAGEWNEVSVGFDRETCAVQVNGRTQRVPRSVAGSNGSRLYFIASGDAPQAKIRNIYRLSDPRPRK